MNPYFTIAKYGAILAVGIGMGGSGVYYTYARPHIDELQADAAKADAAAAIERSKFLADAAVKQQEAQHAVDTANAQAGKDRQARDAARNRANNADVGVRNLIASAGKPVGGGLPQACDCAASQSTAASLGVLAGQLDTYSTGCAAEADRLSDEIRRLEASRIDGKNSAGPADIVAAHAQPGGP